MVLALSSAVTNLPNKILIFHDFQRPTNKFHDFRGPASVADTLNRSTNVLDYGRVGFNQWRIQRGGAGEAGSPRYFWTKLRPEGPKKFFFKTAPTPLISGSGWPPPPPPPALSEGLDRSLSTQAIEAWKVKFMTFQVFHDLYIGLMWKRCQLINVDVRTLKRTFSTHYPSRDSLETD